MGVALAGVVAAVAAALLADAAVNVQELAAAINLVLAKDALENVKMR